MPISFYLRVYLLSLLLISGIVNAQGSFILTSAQQPDSTGLQLISPANGAWDVVLSPTLRWQTTPLTRTYHVVVTGIDSSSLPVFEQIVQVDSSVGYCTANGLNPNTKHHWYVEALSDSGSSVIAKSETWYFTTQNSDSTGLQLISPANGARNVEISPTLNWKTISRTKSYHVVITGIDSSSSPVFEQIVQVDSSTAGYCTVEGLEPATRYRWFVEAINDSGGSVIAKSETRYFDTKRVSEEGSETANIKLHDPRPNPFNPTTTISLSTIKPTKLVLEIYNIVGQKVKTLYTGTLAAGHHQFIWNGKNNNHEKVGSGIYFYHLRSTTGLVKTGKMIMQK